MLQVSLIWIFLASIKLYFVFVKVCGVLVKHDSWVFYVQNEFGVWEIFLPNNADGSAPIPHGSRVKVNNYYWSKRNILCYFHVHNIYFTCTQWPVSNSLQIQLTLAYVVVALSIFQPVCKIILLSVTIWINIFMFSVSLIVYLVLKLNFKRILFTDLLNAFSLRLSLCCWNISGHDWGFIVLYFSLLFLLPFHEGSRVSAVNLFLWWL